MLHIKNLSKNFGANTVLSDINLDIRKGEIVCVIGPSGSGKSTLLRCINYLEKSTGGVIEFEGNRVGDVPSQIKRLRSEIGMVFQEFNLFEMKDVMSNITLAPVLIKKMTKAEAKEEALKVLQFVGLMDKIHAMPNTLSGGQKQRVAIARALAMQPKVLLMDEPTSALDPELIQEVLKVVRMLADQNITMIIVTHQIEFVKEIADRIVFMEKGRIVEEGSPGEILVNPKETRTKEFLQSILQ